jgi:hypothetical protein
MHFRDLRKRFAHETKKSPPALCTARGQKSQRRVSENNRQTSRALREDAGHRAERAVQNRKRRPNRRGSRGFGFRHAAQHPAWRLVPKQRLAKDRAIPTRYQVQECGSKDYARRTELNVKDSDATIAFTIGATLKGGSKKTATLAEKHGKPSLHLSRGTLSVLKGRRSYCGRSSKRIISNV